MIRFDPPSGADPMASDLTKRTQFEEGGRSPLLSVVIPVYDEATTIPELVRRLLAAINTLGWNAEIVFVDDGSNDGTLAAISRAHRLDSRVVGIALSRNFGHQVAITAGLRACRGEVVAVMDGDLQDPPEALAALLERLGEGYDVVYAIRASRREGFLKRASYRIFYRLLRISGTIELPVDAGDFGVMTRRVVDAINAMPERRRYLRGLRAWVGFQQTGVEIDRGGRHAGRSKFTMGKLFGLALDGLMGFSELPLSLLGTAGLGITGVSGVAASLMVGRGLIYGTFVDGWAWIGLLVAFSFGTQLIGMALLGVYLSRVLSEVRGRPLYVVRRRIGYDRKIERTSKRRKGERR